MLDLSHLPEKAPEYDLRVLFEANLHFGHKVAEWNPKMKRFIYTHKNGVHIFNLEETAAQLQLAYNVVYQAANNGKTVVVIGTKSSAKEAVEKFAKEAGCNYITSRWLGGLLTNWPQVSKSLKKMLQIEKKLETEAYKGYTKYEIGRIEKELNRLKRFFDGLRGLQHKPDLLVVVDPTKEDVAIKEANISGVPVVALIDSNGDPTRIDIPVPGNDDAVKSIELFLSEMTKAYLEGKGAQGENKSERGKVKQSVQETRKQ